MLKRIFALLLTLLCMLSPALAEYYIANPDSPDRLHLRMQPSENSPSLGKYYNGAPIEPLGNAQGGWMKVQVGIGAAAQTGYMKQRYLSTQPQADAMPQYIAYQDMTGYTQPDPSPKKTIRISAGQLISLMGILPGQEDWYHIMVYIKGGASEGGYCCFLPASALRVRALGKGGSVSAHISNPNKADRLHLRAEPRSTAKSLGKFYNGTIGTVLGFVAGGQWIRVELYGQTGYMNHDYLYLDGEGYNPTHYGIPTVSTVGSTAKAYLDKPDQTDNYEAILAPGTLLNVLGIIDDEILQVQFNDGGDGAAFYIYRNDTDFVDTRD